MVLYCVIRRIEVTDPDEEPIAVFGSQQEAYSFMKSKDPDKEKDLQIYVVEA